VQSLWRSKFDGIGIRAIHPWADVAQGWALAPLYPSGRIGTCRAGRSEVITEVTLTLRRFWQHAKSRKVDHHMSTAPIQMEPTVKYPDKWMPIDFVCKCGAKRRVDVEVVLGFSQFYPVFLRAHCRRDEEHLLPGRVIQVWEER